MITLDQIRTLDSKVQQTVGVIESLRKENATLREKLSSYEEKIAELEVLIDGFKSDQGEIEEGIQKALKRLDLISSEAVKQHTSAGTEEESGSEDEYAGKTAQPSREYGGAADSIKNDQDDISMAESDEEESQAAELDIF